MTLTLERYQSLGQKDSQAQHLYHEDKIKELKKFWVCSCGERLHASGFVWKKRFEDFIDSNFFRQPEEIRCGYYCDNCAGRREAGMD